MSIFVPLGCVSAALAAGLALAMPAAGNAPAIAAPAESGPVAKSTVAMPSVSIPVAACRQAAWPYVPAACAAGARPVRLIALGEPASASAPASPARLPGRR
ncbi:MAG TPA: hypothetical protein VGN94_02090 [Methylobacterium sp.]|nr:hypothetical protein [Methylobacterium sp.]